MDESSYPPFLWEKPDPLPESSSDLVETEPEPWNEGTDVTGETIAVVKEYVLAYPDQAARILDDESVAQNRTTLVAWLEQFITDHETE